MEKPEVGAEKTIDLLAALKYLVQEKLITEKDTAFRHVLDICESSNDSHVRWYFLDEYGSSESNKKARKDLQVLQREFNLPDETLFWISW